VRKYKTRSKGDANSTQRTKAQRREPGLTIVLTVISNQPPEPEAAEPGAYSKDRNREEITLASLHLQEQQTTCKSFLLSFAF
jgi:hypothetical protein